MPTQWVRARSDELCLPCAWGQCCSRAAVNCPARFLVTNSRVMGSTEMTPALGLGRAVLPRVRPFSPLCCGFSSYDKPFFLPLFCLGKQCWVQYSICFPVDSWIPYTRNLPCGEANLAFDSSSLPRAVATAACCPCASRELPSSWGFFSPPLVSPRLSLFWQVREAMSGCWAAFGEGKGPVSSSAALASACLLCKGLL